MTALDLVIIMAVIFGGVSGLFALGNFIIEVVCMMSPRAKAYVDERNAEMQMYMEDVKAAPPEEEKVSFHLILFPLVMCRLTGKPLSFIPTRKQ